jgi:hypothetical protein
MALFYRNDKVLLMLIRFFGDNTVWIWAMIPVFRRSILHVQVGRVDVFILSTYINLGVGIAQSV